MNGVIEVITNRLYDIFSYLNIAGERVLDQMFDVLVGRGMDPYLAAIMLGMGALVLVVMVIKKCFKFVAAGIAIIILITALADTNAVGTFYEETQKATVQIENGTSHNDMMGGR